MELHLSDFDGKKLKKPATLPVLFVASWCPFCRMFSPQFESAMKDNGIEWAEVDVSDMSNLLWEIFNIDVVPTVIVFKNGEPALRKDGVLGRGLSSKAIEDVVDELRG